MSGINSDRKTAELNIRAKAAMEKAKTDFNNLPFEERKRIGRYMTYYQVLTMYQLLDFATDMQTLAWRRGVREWLKNCVANLEKQNNE